MQHEWARTADDVLWRRTKLGLKVGKAEKEALALFMAQPQSSA
jgi:glycerol-3-phosphate dehydrogenase